ncbi:hypothetical protein QCE47_18205 [Caballeronia sp. LZ025]|uniref:hypothetical protein n=1 Tax=Caballeronia sp. LZ025 TaxID=3038562 RepID=UPI00285ED317|nr:hypothetical protein [Caballeronia sp. LZ025]MDR5734243.1 hypothetical protein [Caballeronia sp. LZ025]
MRQIAAGCITKSIRHPNHIDSLQRQKRQHGLIKSLGMLTLRSMSAAAQHEQVGIRHAPDETPADIHRHEAVVASPDDERKRLDFVQPMPVFLGLLRTIVPASVNAIIGAILDVPPSLPLLLQIVLAKLFKSVLRGNIGIVFQ